MKVLPVPHLWLNLTRAVELAKSLGWTLNVVADRSSYPNALDDFRYIKAYYGEELFSIDGNLTVEIVRPSKLDTSYSEYELQVKQITELPHSLPVQSAAIKLLAKATERLDLSAYEVEKVRHVAVGIASYNHNELTIKVEDMAEAIHYCSSIINYESIVYLTNGAISFGQGITFDPFKIEINDIDNAIEYLTKLKKQ